MIKPPDSNLKTRWVVSDTAPTPHVVTTMKGNKLRYVCDKQCIGWKTHNICAHCIAVAEDNELEQFLVWFASSKGKECNLMLSIMAPINMQDQRRHQEGSMVMLPTYQFTTKPIDFLFVMFLTYSSRQYVMIIHMQKQVLHAEQGYSKLDWTSHMSPSIYYHNRALCDSPSIKFTKE